MGAFEEENFHKFGLISFLYNRLEADTAEEV